MNWKSCMRAKSGTCNVCSVSCSTCMHHNLSLMASKNDELFDETCHQTSASQFSVNKGDVSPSLKGEPYDSLQHTASEARNLLSVNSSHDSVPVNAESKATLRSSDISDASEDFATYPKFSSSGTVSEDQLSPKPEGIPDQRILSNKHDDSQVVEGHANNLSCVRGNNGNTAVSHPNRNADIKNSSHSSALVCSLDPERSEKALSEADTDKDSVDPSVEDFKCSGQDEQDSKSTELAELPDLQGPPSQAASVNESDDDIVEHDVKVCDICGDAGREDLLAICSRCSDGAEHTYCMRDRLKKLPEGDWLCEECKLAEETENQKQGSDAEEKRTNKIRTSNQNSCKRHSEELEGAPAAKKQAIETSVGSPKPSSPNKTATLSRDSSFKSLDKGKVRPSSFGIHSSNDVWETTRPSITPSVQASKGTLLKSNSFSTVNPKPRIKLVDEVVPQKQKGTREQASLDIKEGPTRVMGKSMSFRSANSARSNTSESKFKTLSPRFSHVQDIKELKPVKERNVFERRNLSKLDRPLPGPTMASSAVSTPKVDQKLTPRGEILSFSSTSNNRESKVVKSEGKDSTLSRSNSSLARRGGVEVPVTPVGALSTNGMCTSSVEQKPNPITPKEERSSSSSWTAERPSNIVNEILQDGLPRSLESANQGEKNSISSPRPTLTTASKGVPCQKCQEFGHDVECCPIGIPQACSSDVSAGKNSREDMIKGNKLKSAIEAAMTKLPVAYGRNRVNDQSDDLSMTSVDLNCGRASQSNHLKQFSAHATDVMFPSRVRDSNFMVPSVAKTAMRDWSGHALTTMSVILKMSAIPEHEYIWQGAFEVHRGGNFLDLCDGIQAHLSSCASPKVLEAVNKFPQKIHFNEMPRLSTWPSKFCETGAKEDSIALYFFARDHESYERNYKGLLDSMIKNDLALKGDLDGIELLIFPSNQLPQNCQRWNMLFFLWGVFRKLCLPKHIDQDACACDSSHDIAPISYGLEKTCTTINGDFHKKVSCVEQTSLASQANSDQQESKHDSSFSSRMIDVQLSPEMRHTSSSLEERSLTECGQSAELKPYLHLRAIRTRISLNKVEKTEMHEGASPVGEDDLPLTILPVGYQDLGIKGTVGAEKRPDIMTSGREQVDLERDFKEEDEYMHTGTSLQRNLSVKEHNEQQFYHRKHPHLDLIETEAQTSSCRSKNLPWNEVFVDGESATKKLRTGFSGTYGCSSSSRDSRDSFVDDLGPSSSVEEKRCDEVCDEKVIPEDLGSTERYFFPVDTRVKHIQLGPNSMLWKAFPSKDEDQFCDGVPNLELALGAETKPPNKGMLPLFVETLDKNINLDKPSDKASEKKEEDVSASLSLSLSFPFPDKEQSPTKPVLKIGQLLPERHPLILFGGFLDK